MTLREKIMFYLQQVEMMNEYSEFISTFNIAAGINAWNICIEDVCDRMVMHGMLETDGHGRFKIKK
jgi:hypothetical protein